MSVLIVTGSCGLIGSQCVLSLNKEFDLIIGIDSDKRRFFFGKEGSIIKTKKKLLNEIDNYIHYDNDLIDTDKISKIFKKYNKDIKCIIHTAAQPSHDWASKNIIEDFKTNTFATLLLLENFRMFSPKASFIFTSTNKIYGSNPNKLPFHKVKKRFDLKKSNKFYKGIDESFNIDNTIHSFFGVSKTSADLYVQEYGKNFDLNTVIFRGGCLTGPEHKGVELHGFLSYLVKSVKNNKEYKIFGYEGLQVRDNIHSSDMVKAFMLYHKNPKKKGVVYNIGGTRENSCSVLEALEITGKISGNKPKFKIYKNNRTGDHKWWITNIKKLQNDYPMFKIEHDLPSIISEILG